MKDSKRMLFILSLALLAFTVVGCGGGSKGAADTLANGSSSKSGGSGGSGSGGGGGQAQEIRLLAKGQAVVNGKEVTLNGDFRNDTTRIRLQGDLEDAGLATGTSVSFCLTNAAGTTALAVGVIGQNDENEVEDADEAEFGLDSQKGQTVPNVAVGDKLEAHQGTGANGAASCTGALIISATFQADPNNNNNANNGNNGNNGNNNNNQDVELIAKASVEQNENEASEVSLNGDFRVQSGRTRLKGSFEDGALAVGTQISFCLVTASGSTAVGVGTLRANDNPAEIAPEAEFSLDSQKGQSVPTVVAGNTLEAHQGANADGSANCTGTLLISATFQPKN